MSNIYYWELPLEVTKFHPEKVPNHFDQSYPDIFTIYPSISNNKYYIVATIKREDSGPFSSLTSGFIILSGLLNALPDAIRVKNIDMTVVDANGAKFLTHNQIDPKNPPNGFPPPRVTADTDLGPIQQWSAGDIVEYATKAGILPPSKDNIYPLTHKEYIQINNLI